MIISIRYRWYHRHPDLYYIEGIPQESLILLYRDWPGPKLSEQFIHNHFGLTGIENETLSDYDDGDYDAHIRFCYHGVQRLIGLSSEMHAAILMVWTLTTGDRKKKGGRYIDRIINGRG